MRRYSKAPEHGYDADLRRDVLNAARATHGAEIGRGLAWLDRAAEQFAVVRDATRRLNKAR
jgi:Ser/Thr protein kinase RdoA (MazF antagonist)